MGQQPSGQERSKTDDSRNSRVERSRGPSSSHSAEPEQTSGLAIASLVCGVGGLLFCGVPALAGLILGIMAMHKIKASDGRLGGYGMALAGTIVSAIVIVLGILIVIGGAMLMPDIARVHPEAQKAACINNLRNIGIAMAMHQKDHDEWPETLEDLHPDYVEVQDVFQCPAAGEARKGEFPNSYIYRKPPADARGPNTPVIFDRPENHSDGRCVLFADKHAEFLSEEEWRRLEEDEDGQ